MFEKEFEVIQRLKKEKNAIILAHYYVPDEVQMIADAVGDSYYLSKLASSSSQKTIVFCGVRFMGESAKLLSPHKKVLMPDLLADCPMAHMADSHKVKQIKESIDDCAVVTYINSTAQLKAVSDVCVTSSNAIRIIKSLPHKNIYFIPDQNLGRYVASQIPEKNFIFNEGFCPIHQAIKAQSILNKKEQHPNACVLAHPECTQEVLAISDFIGSTSALIEYAQRSECSEFIIATEGGILFELQRKCPNKQFFLATQNQVCKDMKLNTLQKVIDALTYDTHQIELSQDLYNNARQSLQTMIDLAQ